MMIEYSYDPQGRETEKKWFDGNSTLLKKTKKTYNAFHLIFEMDANDIATHYTYDYAGRLVSERTQEKITLYTYDTLGRQTKSSQQLEDGTTISFIEVHDAQDRIVESYTLSANNQIYNRILKSYDTQGKVILSQEWNQAGIATTKTEYDEFGRVTCITNPLGKCVHTVYSEVGTPRQEVTDPLGIKTVTSYDPFGHPITERRYDLMGQLVEQTDYAYDANGNKILRRITTTTQPVDTNWEYDVLNQLKKTTEAAGTPEQRSMYRKYDAAGRVIILIKSDGTSLEYNYDALGRRTSLKSSDGTLFYTYSYDINDNMLSTEDRINGTAINRTYDEYDQLISDTLPYGHSLSYEYDLLGNVKQVALPDQSKVIYSRQGNRLLSVSREGTLTYSHTYTSYDESSNPTNILLAANAGTLQVDYDLLNRPLEIRSANWQETLDYEHHLLKQRTSKDTFGEAISSYTYDARDQLLSENGTASHNFEYDWQGNPIAYDGHSRKFNSCNALLDDGQHEYSYDLNGNRTSDGINSYRYDALDRLIEATTPLGTYHYVYDGLGRRVARSSEQNITYFLWQKDQEIGTISSKGIIQELQVLNPSNHAIAFELQGVLYVPYMTFLGMYEL